MAPPQRAVEQSWSRAGPSSTTTPREPPTLSEASSEKQKTPDPRGSGVSYLLRQDNAGCLRNSSSRPDAGQIEPGKSAHPLRVTGKSSAGRLGGPPPQTTRMLDHLREISSRSHSAPAAPHLPRRATPRPGRLNRSIANQESTKLSLYDLPDPLLSRIQAHDRAVDATPERVSVRSSRKHEAPLDPLRRIRHRVLFQEYPQLLAADLLFLDCGRPRMACGIGIHNDRLAGRGHLICPRWAGKIGEERLPTVSLQPQLVSTPGWLAR